MAAIAEWFWSILEYFGFFSKSAKILLLGLDNAGKTTLLYMMKDNRVISSPPTIHPNMEELRIGSVDFQTWDLGGHAQARRVWDDYITTVDGIVFMVDAADPDRFMEARKELNNLLEIDALKDVPFLVLGNKIDRPECASEHAFKYALGLTMTTGKEIGRSEDVRSLEVFMCSVVRRSGFGEGFRWLSRQI